MFCTNCGRENPEGTTFCQYCGQFLETQKGVSLQKPDTNYNSVPEDVSQPVQTVDNEPEYNNSYDNSYNGFENETKPNKGKGLAIASMVLGIVALVISCCLYFISIPCGIVGLILGIISLKNKYDGRGMAIAGVVCSLVSFIPALFVIIVGIVMPSWLGQLSSRPYYL